MLSPLDEMPWHQTPDTFDHVITSDPRFFDRHWFAVYEPDGSRAFQLSMGVYSNMNVLDAQAVFVVGQQQHNLRSSRSLRPHFLMECSPFRLDVVEPLRELTWTIEAGDYPAQGEITWTATSPPEQEHPNFSRKRGRVVTDYQRYDQMGVCHGWVELAGERIEIDQWWSARDHAWGVRAGVSVLEPVTGIDDRIAAEAIESARDSGRVHAWSQVGPNQPMMVFLLFFSTPEYHGHVQIHSRDNRRVRLDGQIGDMRSPEAPMVHVVDATIRAALHPGTHRFRTAQLDLELEDGRQLSFALNPHGSSVAMHGLGYSGGYRDGRGLGAWRGDHVVEYETWDVSDPEVVVLDDGSTSRPLHRLQPVNVKDISRKDSSYGTGSVTLVFNGELPDEVIPL